MTKELILLLGLLTPGIDIGENLETSKVIPTEIVVNVPVGENTLNGVLETDILLEAIIMVESRGNDSAYCKREDAAGCLQIRPIMVKEVNRILTKQESTKRYTLLDRWDRQKSIEIFYIVNGYYNNNTYEEMARSWNGGPTGITKSSTKKYWRKVQRKFKKLIKEDEYSYDWLAQL